MMKLILATIVTACCGLLAYGASGWIDAKRDAVALAQRADHLIAENLGGSGLGDERLQWLLEVQDPGFFNHGGVDLLTDGAGITTITQSVSKRLAFQEFKPGIAKLRQSTYAMGLEHHLSKDQIMALFLDTVSMGRGPSGWMTGFYRASAEIYRAPPDSVSDKQFITLVSVLIAPGRLSLDPPNQALRQRERRIQKLLDGDCSPADNADVWFEQCT